MQSGAEFSTGKQSRGSPPFDEQHVRKSYVSSCCVLSHFPVETTKVKPGDRSHVQDRTSPNSSATSALPHDAVQPPEGAAGGDPQGHGREPTDTLDCGRAEAAHPRAEARVGCSQEKGGQRPDRARDSSSMGEGREPGQAAQGRHGGVVCHKDEPDPLRERDDSCSGEGGHVLDLPPCGAHGRGRCGLREVRGPAVHGHQPVLPELPGVDPEDRCRGSGCRLSLAPPGDLAPSQPGGEDQERAGQGGGRDPQEEDGHDGPSKQWGQLRPGGSLGGDDLQTPGGSGGAARGTPPQGEPRDLHGWQLRAHDGAGLSGGEEAVRPQALAEEPSDGSPVFKNMSATQASFVEHESWGVVPGLFQSLVVYDRPVVMEVACQPDSLISQHVQQVTGRESASCRYSLWNGADLSTDAGVRLVLERVRTEQPSNIWVAPPCGPYSPLQRTNARTESQIADLQKKRQHAQRIYAGAAVVCRYAFQLGCHVTWEWSERCDGWRMPWMQRMIQELGMKTAVTHGCRVGLKSSKDHRLLRKGWKIATTSRLAEVMHATCQCPSQYQHGRCEGQDAETSARYTSEYARRVARVLCQELNHSQVVDECRGKSALPVMFGLGSTCQCSDRHFQQHERKCGHCDRHVVSMRHDPPDPCAAQPRTDEPVSPEVSEEPTETAEVMWSKEEMVLVETEARKLLQEGDFTQKSCERLVSLLPRGPKQARSGLMEKQARYHVFGAYAHGAQYGQTRKTSDFPLCAKYLNSFLQQYCPPGYAWSSVVVNENNEVPAHRDVNNLKGHPNLVVGLGDYKGGELWVQENVESLDKGWNAGVKGPLVEREVRPGERLWGRLYPTKGKAVMFPPNAWHQSEPWTGCRITVSAYMSRAATHVTPEVSQQLRSKGFPLPPKPLAEACAAEGSETGEVPGRETERLKRQLYLLHAATGHCSTNHLVAALKRRGARPEVIKLAEEFRCSICEEKKRVLPRHVASLEPLPPKFHTISADVGHWQHPHSKEHVQFLCVIDEGSRFRIAKVVSKGQKQQPSGATCVQYLQEGWSQIFGQPRTLRLDPAGNFRSKTVEQFCDQQEIFLDIVPGEAHWKIGVCEQAVQGLKMVMEKLAQADQDIFPEEALSTAVRTFNQREIIRGFSPVQHVLGQAPDESGRVDVATPAVPPELLVENPSGEFQRAVLRRQEAEKALAEWTARQRLVRASNSRTRPVADYRPGDLVFFWRSQEAGKGRREPGNKHGRFVGPARILAMERKTTEDGSSAQSSSIWLVRGRQLIKACAEQLRRASPREELVEAVTERQPTPWTFSRVAEQLGGNQFEDVSGHRPSLEEWRRAQDPQEEVQPVRERNALPVRHRFRGKRPALEDYSEDEEMIPDEPSASSSSRRPTSHRRIGGQGFAQTVEQGARWQDQIPESAWFSGEQVFWANDRACVELSIEVPESQRGLRQMVDNLECYLASALRRRAVEVSERHLNDQEKQEFREAKQIEVKNFLAARAFEALPDHLKPDRATALGMRWCLTWKTLDAGGVKAKARAVLLGYQDPCYEHRATAAPVMSRQSRQMLLQQAATRRWTVFKGDVSGAFLQGRDYEGLLHVVPCDEICEAMGLPKGSVTRLRKSCYGLVEAPLEWYRSVNEFMLSLGLERSWSDPCMWLWRPNGQLRGIISSHVDDFLFAGSSQDTEWEAILASIRKQFKWSDWEKDDFVQCGVRIRREGNNFVLSQEQYIDSISEIPLNTNRKRDRKAPTTDRERTQLRALLGSLSWLVQQTAPHVSADVGLLLSEVGSSTVDTVVRSNILLSHVKARRTHKMVIHGYEPRTPLGLYAWVDAGSQNRVNGGSTQGIFVGIGPMSLQEGELGQISPISWHSSKIDRACRSPGAAEAQAAVNGEDCLFFARYQWSEIEKGNVDPRDAVASVKKTPGCLITDSRNVYDKLREEVLTIKGAEKRTSIELIGLKESQFSTGLQLRWVHSEAQLANGLTKSAGGKELDLYYHMGHCWKIVEDPLMRSARKRRADGVAPLEGNEITRGEGNHQKEEGGGADASEITCSALISGI